MFFIKVRCSFVYYQWVYLLKAKAEIDAKEAAENAPLTDEEKLQKFKNKRVGLLRNSDWTQLPDNQLSDSKVAEWKVYRQQLRDLPANTSDPENPTWPTQPS